MEIKQNHISRCARRMGIIYESILDVHFHDQKNKMSKSKIENAKIENSKNPKIL